MNEELRLGKYLHTKSGNHYEVLGVARHSEDHKQEFVVYRALYNHEEFGDNSLWIRPLSMFTEMVILNGEQVPRFQYVGSSESKF